MVNSLQSLVLFSVPIAVLFDMLKILHHLPRAMSVSAPCSEDVPTKSYERGPKRCRGTTPSPGNSITRFIAAAWLVSFMAFHFFWAWVPFPYTFFFIFIEVFKGFDFLRTVLWPVHLCLCPRRARLNWAARFWVPNCSC